MCDIEFDETCPVFEEEASIMSTDTYKGRPHLCSSCGVPIRRGDVYMRHSDLFEGSWSRERMCFLCWWSREKFCDEHRVTFAPSMLEQLLRECIIDNSDRKDPWRGDLAALLKRERMTAPGR